MTKKVKDVLNEFIEDHHAELLKPVREIDWKLLYEELRRKSSGGLEVIKAFYDLVNSLSEVQEAGGFVKWSGVKTIKQYYYPKNSTTITIPDGVKSIGEWAFSYYNISFVTIPEGVKEIGKYAFCDCYSLTSITLPKSLQILEEGVFEGCKNLISITIPNNINEIINHAFYNCSALTSITFSKNIKKICSGAFAYCAHLTSITILEGVEEIDRYAFQGCSSLTSITLSKSLKKIGTRTFVYCINLKSITYLGTKADWKEVDVGTQENYLTVNCIDGRAEME